MEDLESVIDRFKMARQTRLGQIDVGLAAVKAGESQWENRLLENYKCVKEKENRLHFVEAESSDSASKIEDAHYEVFPHRLKQWHEIKGEKVVRGKVDGGKGGKTRRSKMKYEEENRNKYGNEIRAENKDGYQNLSQKSGENRNENPCDSRSGRNRNKNWNENRRRGIKVKKSNSPPLEWSYFDLLHEEERDKPHLLEWEKEGFHKTTVWKAKEEHPVISTNHPVNQSLWQSVNEPFGLKLLNKKSDQHPLYSQGGLGKMSLYASAQKGVQKFDSPPRFNHELDITGKGREKEDKDGNYIDNFMTDLTDNFDDNFNENAEYPDDEKEKESAQRSNVAWLASFVSTSPSFA